MIRFKHILVVAVLGANGIIGCKHDPFPGGTGTGGTGGMGVQAQRGAPEE